MLFLHAILCILGGLLASSGLVIGNRPETKQYNNKLMPETYSRRAPVRPYQGLVGVVMLALGLYNIIRGGISAGIYLLDVRFAFGLTVLLTLFSEMVVGFLLGYSFIAKWIPGEGKAEQKGLEIQKKLMKFQGPFGIVSIIAGLLLLYYHARY